MAEKYSRPELDVCIETAGRIVSTAIESGQLSAEVDQVCDYFDKLYVHIVKLRRGMLSNEIPKQDVGNIG